MSRNIRRLRRNVDSYIPCNTSIKGDIESEGYLIRRIPKGSICRTSANPTLAQRVSCLEGEVADVNVALAEHIDELNNHEQRISELEKLLPPCPPDPCAGSCPDQYGLPFTNFYYNYNYPYGFGGLPNPGGYPCGPCDGLPGPGGYPCGPNPCGPNPYDGPFGGQCGPFGGQCGPFGGQCGPFGEGSYQFGGCKKCRPDRLCKKHRHYRKKKHHKKECVSESSECCDNFSDNCSDSPKCDDYSSECCNSSCECSESSDCSESSCCSSESDSCNKKCHKKKNKKCKEENSCLKNLLLNLQNNCDKNVCCPKKEECCEKKIMCCDKKENCCEKKTVCCEQEIGPWQKKESCCKEEKVEIKLCNNNECCENIGSEINYCEHCEHCEHSESNNKCSEHNDLNFYKSFYQQCISNPYFSYNFQNQSVAEKYNNEFPETATLNYDRYGNNDCFNKNKDDECCSTESCSSESYCSCDSCNSYNMHDDGHTCNLHMNDCTEENNLNQQYHNPTMDFQVSSDQYLPHHSFPEQFDPKINCQPSSNMEQKQVNNQFNNQCPHFESEVNHQSHHVTEQKQVNNQFNNQCPHFESEVNHQSHHVTEQIPVNNQYPHLEIDNASFFAPQKENISTPDACEGILCNFRMQKDFPQHIDPDIICLPPCITEQIPVNIQCLQNVDDLCNDSCMALTTIETIETINTIVGEINGQTDITNINQPNGAINNNSKILWATKIEGGKNVNSSNVTIDYDGNIITAAYLPGNIVTELPTNYSIYNADGTVAFAINVKPGIIVIKYDTKGKVIWYTAIEGTVIANTTALTTDNCKNIILTYANTGLLGTYTTISIGSVIRKFDANGNLLWYSPFIADIVMSVAYVATDIHNNIFVTGYYNCINNEFINSDGTSSSVHLPSTSSSSNNVFVAKYNSAGFALWATNMGNANSSATNKGLAIAVSPDGSVVVTGFYGANPLDINDAPNATVYSGFSLVNSNNDPTIYDVFVVKYSTDGKAMWATRIGGIHSDSGNSITVDKENNIIVTGQYESDPLYIYNVPNGTIQSLTLVNKGFANAFIVKYDSLGIALWATNIGGTSNDSGNNITTDSDNNIIVTGFYESNPVIAYNANGTAGPSLVNYGSSDAFLVKYTPAGKILWATKQSGTKSDNGTGVATDIVGSIVEVGNFDSPLLNMYNSDGLIATSLNDIGSIDTFIVKYINYGQNVVLPSSLCDQKIKQIVLTGYNGSNTLITANGLLLDPYGNLANGILLISRCANVTLLWRNSNNKWLIQSMQDAIIIYI